MMHKHSSHISPQKSLKAATGKAATASVVGARGYAGLELVRLLLKHPYIKLTHAFATREFHLSQDLLHPGAAQVTCLTDDQVLSHLTDVVFLATPADVSLALAPKILDQGKIVIDLSGAFRLKQNNAQKWYGLSVDPALSDQADYGLAPFCGPLKTNTKLISNPGCYATAISLALIPLLQKNLLEPATIVVDAKSGTTGAGRKAVENQLFAEVDGECLPYRVGRHQHTPEIQKAVETWAGEQIDPFFVTHLLPVKRGIIASICAKSRTLDPAAIEAAFAESYDGYPLVRYGQNVGQLAKLQNVVGTPFTHISYTLIENKLYLFSTIDNLLKGAASQAIENLNRALDLPLSFSLVEEE